VRACVRVGVCVCMRVCVCARARARVNAYCVYDCFLSQMVRTRRSTGMGSWYLLQREQHHQGCGRGGG
jgi:hypothetical protein